MAVSGFGRQIVKVGTSLSASVPFAPGVPLGQSGITVEAFAGSSARDITLSWHTIITAKDAAAPTTKLPIRRETKGNMLFSPVIETRRLTTRSAGGAGPARLARSHSDHANQSDDHDWSSQRAPAPVTAKKGPFAPRLTSRLNRFSKEKTGREEKGDGRNKLHCLMKRKRIKLLLPSPFLASSPFAAWTFPDVPARFSPRPAGPNAMVL